MRNRVRTGGGLMAKLNTVAQLILAQQEIVRLRANMDVMKAFTVQQCLDIAQIALGDEFGFGPERQKRFKAAYESVFVEYAQMCVSDAGDDEEIVYTKAVMDRRLKQTCGEIVAFDDRYNIDRLYFRDKHTQAPKKPEKKKRWK